MGLLSKWLGATHSIELFMQRLFGRIGRRSAERPKLTILIALILTILPLAGFLNLRFELKMVRFMVDQNSDVVKNFDRQAEEWGDLRQNTFTFYRGDKANVLTRDNVKQIYAHFKAVANNDKFRGVCFKPLESRDVCAHISVLQYYECAQAPCVSVWDSANFEPLLDSLDPMTVVGNRRATAVDFLGLPINHRLIFGTATPTDLTQAVTSVSALATTAPTIRPPGGDVGLPEQWEADFLDYFEDRASGVDGTTLNYISQRSEQDEIMRSSFGSLDLVAACVFIMIGYVCVVFGGIPLRSSRLLLGFAAVANVMQSITAAFGLAFAFGWPVTPASQLSLFVTLGIGVDGMFVLLTELTTFKQHHAAHGRFQKHSYTDIIPEALEYACAHMGPSVFLSTCTSILAFCTVGSSNFPILRTFTLTTAIALAINYAMTLTFFTACVALDEARIEKQHLDVLPWCITSSKMKTAADIQPDDQTVSQALFTKFGKVLMKTPSRIFAFIFFIGLFAVGVYGVTELNIKFELSDFLPSDSYATDFQNSANDRFPHLGDQVEFHFGDHDYTTIQNQVALRDLGVSLIDPARSKFYNSQTFQSWYAAVLQAAPALGISLTAEGVIPSNQFYTAVNAVLANAEVLKNDVKFDNGRILKSRIRIEQVPFTKVDSESNDAMDDAFALSNALPFDAYPFTLNYVFEQMFKQVNKELVLNLTVAWAVVTVFLLIVTHPGMAIVMSIILASVETQLVGFVGLALSMDPVVMSSIVIAIGLAIDYQLHLAHGFWLQEGTRKERAVGTLALLGGSVINAGLSTFLGVFVLLFGRAPAFFTFSLTYLMIILLGELHGVVLLPVILSFIGPKTYGGEKHTSNMIAPAKDVELGGTDSSTISSTTQSSTGAYQSTSTGQSSSGVRSSSTSSSSESSGSSSSSS